MARTFYQRLKVPSDATQEMINAAFRRLALRYHPDKVVHLDEVAQRSALRKMQGISEAFAALRNPELRKFYDHCLAERLDFAVEAIHFKPGETYHSSSAAPPEKASDSSSSQKTVKPNTKVDSVVKAIANIPNFAYGDKLGSDGCFDEIIKGRYRRDRCLIHVKHVRTLALDVLEEVISRAEVTVDADNAVLSRACHSFVLIADKISNAQKVNFLIESFNKKAALAPRGVPLRVIVLLRKGDAVPFIPHGATVSPPFILLRLA